MLSFLSGPFLNFVSKTTIEKFKKIFHEPEHIEHIENALLREKYCQQNRGKRAGETEKQATYNRLR